MATELPSVLIRVPEMPGSVSRSSLQTKRYWLPSSATADARAVAGEREMANSEFCRGERGKGRVWRLRREGVRQDSEVMSKRCAGCVLDTERERFVKLGCNSAKRVHLRCCPSGLLPSGPVFAVCSSYRERHKQAAAAGAGGRGRVQADGRRQDAMMAGVTVWDVALAVISCVVGMHCPMPVSSVRPSGVSEIAQALPVQQDSSGLMPSGRHMLPVIEAVDSDPRGSQPAGTPSQVLRSASEPRIAAARGGG